MFIPSESSISCLEWHCENTANKIFCFVFQVSWVSISPNVYLRTGCGYRFSQVSFSPLLIYPKPQVTKTRILVSLWVSLTRGHRFMQRTPLWLPSYGSIEFFLLSPDVYLWCASDANTCLQIWSQLKIQTPGSRNAYLDTGIMQSPRFFWSLSSEVGYVFSLLCLCI